MKLPRKPLIALLAAPGLLPLWGQKTASAAPKEPKNASAPLAKGLEIWRKPGSIQNGAACATCHSPDGIELALYNFDDKDILRRAEPHLGPVDAPRVVAYIHALRAHLHLTQLRDPERDRPLQPGGEVLPGATPAERDFAFGTELQSKLPILFGPPIDTVERAQAAEKQLLSVPATTLKIGIPLSRLSEDVAHGTDHASISQWLPEEPPLIDAKDLKVWYAAEDAYLANPTPEALQKLIRTHSELVNINLQPGLAAISTVKFRSLLVLQDRMRHRTEQSDFVLADDMKAPGSYNVFWNLGEYARNMIGISAQGLQMSPTVQANKIRSIPLFDQLKQIRITWFWLGWLSDQGLFKTSHDVQTRYGMWFSESISGDGPYPIHNVYANARRQAVISNDLESWAEPLDRRRRVWDMSGLRTFHHYSADMPSASNPDYRKLYVTFTDNCFRMNLLLFKQSILATHQVWVKTSSRAIVKEMCRFMEAQEPSSQPTLEAQKNELLTLIDSADERQL